MANVINNMKLSDTLDLTECVDGFWLYDKTRGMNLAMRAKTKEEAFTWALMYYQERLSHIEAELKTVNNKVSAFIDQFSSEDD